MKKKQRGITLIVLIVLILLCILLILVDDRNKIISIIDKKKMNEDIDGINYKIYHSNEGNIKMLITFQDKDNGINKIIYPNEEKIVMANNKKKVSIDYNIHHTANNEERYEFKLINSYNEEVKKTVIINDQILNDLIGMEINEEGIVKKLKIIYNDNDDIKEYRIPGISNDYIKYEDDLRLHIGNLKNLIDQDGNVLIEIKETDKAGNSVVAKKKVNMTVENNLKIINDESLIKCIENNDLTTGYYRFNVNDEEYYVHSYVFNGNQEWDNMTFGDENDVGNYFDVYNKNATNMIVVKVNGDITINANSKITSYANKDGYGGPKGMVIYCTGTFVNNGNVSMTERGARADGQNIYMWKNNDNSSEYIPAYSDNNINGTIRKTGNGGSGGHPSEERRASGGVGTSYSGGAGAGGSGQNYGKIGIAGGNCGGAGGDGTAGGAGNPGGMPWTRTKRG